MERNILHHKISPHYLFIPDSLCACLASYLISNLIRKKTLKGPLNRLQYIFCFYFLFFAAMQEWWLVMVLRWDSNGAGLEETKLQLPECLCSRLKTSSIFIAYAKNKSKASAETGILFNMVWLIIGGMFLSIKAGGGGGLRRAFELSRQGELDPTSGFSPNLAARLGCVVKEGSWRSDLQSWLLRVDLGGGGAR